MARHKDSQWNLPDVLDWEHVKVALLMDIRDELREVRRRFGPLQCTNFLTIPQKLDAIQANTTKVKRRRKKAR